MVYVWHSCGSLEVKDCTLLVYKPWKSFALSWKVDELGEGHSGKTRNIETSSIMYGLNVSLTLNEWIIRSQYDGRKSERIVSQTEKMNLEN